ncbi:MAG TPA: 50S ribosomal protein L32 [Victivallales bacterium]|nr:50S ribosomal protein L32 [Victivallales bacterium]HRR06179.1 50S ribosomal protein L32 [Victivallales bacterium]HRU02253.1 50S ribosomal protein L32 [Victivallales bacterium]
MKKRQMKAGRPHIEIQAHYCASCGKPVQPHRVCKACGYYSKEQIITPKTKKTS